VLYRERVLADFFNSSGPLRNNILIAVVIFSVLEFLLWYLFWYLDLFAVRLGKQIALAMGVILLLVMVDLGMYFKVNAIPVPVIFSTVLTYIGLSHVLYAMPERAKIRR
jgi:hypothetical protein